MSQLLEAIKDRVLSITEYLELVNSLLKQLQCKIKGEVSAVKHDKKGHVYFTLQDKDNGHILECVIWSSNYRLCGVELMVGAEVLIQGSADVYAPKGRFAFKAETLELVGEGALRQRYEQLKTKLTLE